MGYWQTRQILERSLLRTAARRAVTPRDMDQAMRIGSLAKVAGRNLPIPATCLRQSLLVWWLLRRRGFPASLLIGVNTDEGFTAHAWVELEEIPVNDIKSHTQRFRVLERSRP
jgi:hypothetical protein